MVCVRLTNISTIQLKTILCELQPNNTIEDIQEVDTNATADEVFDQVNICTEFLTPDELDIVKHLMRKCSSLFSTDDSDVECTSYEKHRIELINKRTNKQRQMRILPSTPFM